MYYRRGGDAGNIDKKRSLRAIPAEEAPTTTDLDFLLSMCRNEKEEMILRTMWELALRGQEATGLKVSDFVLYGDDYKVFIRKEIAKGDSSGFVPIISEDYLEKLRSYIIRQRLERWDYLFNYTTERKGYTKRHIMRICKNIGRRANMPNFRSHFLRHSRARWLLEKGCAPDTVREFLRHKDIWVTLTIYGNFIRTAHVAHLKTIGSPRWTYQGSRWQAPGETNYPDGKALAPNIHSKT